MEPSPPLRELMASRDIINREVFADFLNTYDDQDRTTSQELVCLYFEEASTRLQEIKGSLAKGNFSACAEAAKNMGDGARPFGIVKVVALSGTLRDCCLQPNERDKAPSCLSELHSAQSEAEGYLRQWYGI